MLKYSKITVWIIKKYSTISLSRRECAFQFFVIMLLGQHALLMILCVFFFSWYFFFLSIFFFSTKSYNIKYINTEGNSFGIHNLCFGFFSSFLWCAITLSPCWSLLEFWKIKLEKSISMNWIFSLQKSISKLIFWRLHRQ